MFAEISSLRQILAALLAVAKEHQRELLWVGFDIGEVESMGSGYATTAEAIEVAKVEFVEFASTCEEKCGEAPTCLYDQVEFVVGPKGLEAVITFRPPTPNDTTRSPVMVVEETGRPPSRLTVESLLSSCAPRESGPTRAPFGRTSSPA